MPESAQSQRKPQWQTVHVFDLRPGQELQVQGLDREEKTTIRAGDKKLRIEIRERL